MKPIKRLPNSTRPNRSSTKPCGNNLVTHLNSTALFRPIRPPRDVVTRELPILLVVTLLAGWRLFDGPPAISELIIGLTIVIPRASLPELASALSVARKGGGDLVLGNILGSNLFNTLVAVGLAGLIRPMTVPPEILTRDLAMAAGLTLLLLSFALK